MARHDLVYRDPKTLKPYERNARTHSPEQVRQIRRAIDEFGNNNPILLRDDDHTIGAGHGRWEAALLEPALPEVPTITLRGLTASQWRAFVLADNKLALNAGWNEDLLRLELGELKDLGFDIGVVGFSTAELSNLFAKGGGATDPDDMPAMPTRVAVEIGDLWLLGDHRLLCGSSTDKDSVARLLDGRKPILMVTDPPYGVDYDPSWRTTALKTTWSKKGTSVGQVSGDDRADWREAWALFPGEVAYVWHAGLHGSEVQASLEAANFILRSQIIWRKQSFPVSRSDYHWQHEPCFYAVRKGGKGHWRGGRKQSTIWDIHMAMGFLKPEDGFRSGHGTQKPVECMRRPIENNSGPGDLVYDPFMGSGTTIIAAHSVGRVAVGLDLDPLYVDLSLQRFANFAKLEPVLAETGESYSVVRARRCPEDAPPAPPAPRRQKAEA